MLCLINSLQYAYRGNNNTKNLTGLRIKLPAYSFNNLPVDFSEIVEDNRNKANVNISQKCYVKSGET